MEKTYKGSCHCGTVSFEVDLDLAQARSGKCNCSFCRKTRGWSVMAQPSAFRQLTGSKDMSDYQFGTQSMHHQFCPDCGVRPFSSGHLDVLGGDFLSINLACLDNISEEELAALPVGYSDGAHDNWTETPNITAHL